MLTKLDKDRASTFRSVSIRANFMSVNRVDVQQAVTEVARFMAEPNEGAWSILKRLVRYLVGHGRLVPGAEAREGTTRGHRQRLRWMRACQEEHDVLRRNKGGSILLGTKSMMIDVGEDVGQCVLATDSSSAQKHHGNTWRRMGSTSALSYALVAIKCGL